MSRAYLAVGSNLGDRESHLRHALMRIGSFSRVIAGSPIYETEPMGGPADQGAFLNAVIGIETQLDARALLESLLEVESERGRVRSERWGPRTLDIDLLWFDGMEIDEPGLTVPHPGIRERGFVLAPLIDVAPGLADSSGPYADAYRAIGSSGLIRRTGPVDETGTRWMVGLEEAVRPAADGSVVAHPDWANTSGDAFGGFLTAVALHRAGSLRPGSLPSHLTYRFLHPVPAGRRLDVSTAVHRMSASSMDLTVTLRLDAEVVGRCAVGVIDRPVMPEVAPIAPRVMALHECIPVTELLPRTDRDLGASIRSWTPLERWDVPDLQDGSAALLRAWSPNVVLGVGDPFLYAAALVMPIDALIWPATMARLGRFPGGPVLATPTIELTARFADLTNDAWFMGEAVVDHITDRSVAGTVRMWGDGGRYLAVGHSLNLVRR